MQHLRNPESMVETMRFSSRVDISEPNPIAKAEAEAKANGITLGKLNDSIQPNMRSRRNYCRTSTERSHAGNDTHAKRWPHSCMNKAIPLPPTTYTY